MAVPAAVDLVDLALKATAAYERPDLGARLAQTRKRLVDPNVRVLVVGEFKQGKSQLVNALVNAPVCPVDDDVATAVPTVVRHSETVAGGARPRDARRAARAHRGAGGQARPVRQRGGQPRQQGDALLRRDRAAAQAPRRRAGARRHPGRRRARLGARGGHDVGAAQRGRRAAGLRRRAGVHGPGAGVPRRGDEAVPERRVRRHQDRPLPALATDHGAGPRPPRRRRDPRRRVPRLVHAAAARREDAGRRTDGRVGLPAAGRLPAAPGGGRRPTSWTAARPARTCWPSASSSPRGCGPSWPCRRTPSSSSRWWPS